MVRSAATLIRERGVHGTGLREVVAHSGGPRGSLGRFFPGGKTQLVTEAIDVALVDLFDDLERTLSEAEAFPEAISVIVSPWRRLLRRARLRPGLPTGRDHLRRGRQRQPPHPCQRVARTVASASRRRLHQVWGAAGGSRSTRDGANGCARGRPHARSRSTQHRAARHSRALLRVTCSKVVVRSSSRLRHAVHTSVAGVGHSGHAAGTRCARVRARASRHQMNSYT